MIVVAGSLSETKAEQHEITSKPPFCRGNALDSFYLVQ
jgi:hypothetical protein